jgi:hypothetical protein
MRRSHPRQHPPRVDRPIGRKPAELNVTEVLQSPIQRGVIGDREIDVEQICQATEEAIGLARRLMKDPANRQRGFDRDVTIGALAARLALGRNSPGIERLIRKPDIPST